MFIYFVIVYLLCFGQILFVLSSCMIFYLILFDVIIHERKTVAGETNRARNCRPETRADDLLLTVEKPSYPSLSCTGLFLTAYRRQ